MTMMSMFQVKEAGLSEFQELFDHEGYLAINHFKLSTSQVPVALPLSFMGEEIELSVSFTFSYCYLAGYGAVVPDGYGVSYNPYSDNIIFCIASFFSCPDTNSRMFASQLQLSLQVRQMSDNQLTAIKIISGDEESVHQVSRDINIYSQQY